MRRRRTNKCEKKNQIFLLYKQLIMIFVSVQREDGLEES